MAILDWLFARGKGRAADDEDVETAIDRVVTAMDRRIHLVNGYARKLRPMARHALDYMGGLAGSVPGPVEISRENWDRDPLVRALFATPQEMLQAFSLDPGVRGFFDAPGNGHAGACYLAIFSTREEKRTVAFALQEEILQADVVRRVASFSAFRLTIPSGDEAGVRAGLRLMGLDFLANRAMEALASARRERQELEEERDYLNMRLQSRRRSGDCLENVLPPEPALPCPDTVDALETRIGETERRLSRLGPGPYTLDEYLRVLQDVLTHAEDYASVEHSRLKLDNMNFLVEESDGEGREVPICEIRAQGLPSRLVFIACFPRRELIAREELLCRAERGVAGAAGL